MYGFFTFHRIESDWFFSNVILCSSWDLVCAIREVHYFWREMLLAWDNVDHFWDICGHFQTLWFSQSHPWKIGCLILVFIFIFWFWGSWCNICNTSSSIHSLLLNCGGIRYALLGSDWCTQTCEIHKVGHGGIASSVRLTTTGSIFICWERFLGYCKTSSIEFPFHTKSLRRKGSRPRWAN